MQFKLANARRSMFCEVMYSSACQRVTMLMRFPTFALPATAPICGSTKRRASARIVCSGKLRVGIERDNHVALRVAQTKIQRRRLCRRSLR